MKKILTIIGLFILCLLTLPSCGSTDRSEYECTIVYTLDDSQHNTTVTIDIPSDYSPAYWYSNDCINIIAVHNGTLVFTCKEIYHGSLKPDVQDFKYNLVRTYKSSIWDGHELKKKK